MNAVIPLVIASCVQGPGSLWYLRTAIGRSRPAFRRQMRHGRSLIIQVKYGTFAATERLSAVLCSHEKGEAMKKTLMALGCRRRFGCFGCGGPGPRPGATRCCRRRRRRIDRRRHRRRRDRFAERLLRPGLLCARATMAAARPMSPIPATARLLLAAPALLGRLWLAGSQRQGLRLSRSFTFIKSDHDVPENARFSGTSVTLWPEKTVFFGH